jgi:HmuY protein
MEPTAMKRCTLSLFPLLALAGCDAWLPHLSDAPDAGGGDGGTTPPGKIQTVQVTDGWQSTVDATDSNTFTGFDLETGLEAPTDAGAWDLSFSRQRIRTNSGVDGDGGVETAVLVDAGFATVLRAPDGGYVVDQAPPPGSAEPATPFDNRVDWAWYDYDSNDHVLTPKPAVFVVKSTAARFYKLELLGYYDGAGTSAVYTVHWAEVPQP